MEESIKQCFQILEVAPNAPIEEVTRAHRDFIKVWHPDRFVDDDRLRQKAEEKLKDLNRAYETLSKYLSDVAEQTRKYAGSSHGQDMDPHYSPTPDPPAEEKSSRFNRGNFYNRGTKNVHFVPKKSLWRPNCAPLVGNGRCEDNADIITSMFRLTAYT